MEWLTKDVKWSMVEEVIIIAIPAIIANMSWMLIEVINLIFVGHSGNTAIVAGLGVGNVFINIFGWAVLLAMNTTLITLVSQAYG